MSNRVCLIRYSKDGGYNWSGWVERSLGEVGDFEKRVKVSRLGKSRNWVFHVRVTSPITAHMVSAAYKLEGAAS